MPFPYRMKEIVVSKNEEGKKLFNLLCAHLPKAPGSILHKSIRNKNIVLNGKRCKENDAVKEGDIVKLFFSDETFEKFSENGEKAASTKSFLAIDDKIEILYEDEDIMLVNKPVGVLSQKAKADDISINEMIIAYLLRSGSLTQDMLKTFRPSVCNRLDRNTGGIILFGKTTKGMQYLSEGIKDRSIHKYYIAVVKGRWSDIGTFEAYLSKDNKLNQVTITKEAVKDSQLIKTKIVSYDYNEKKDLTTLEIELLTGRAHQIRAYLSSRKHPIVGDPKYGDMKLNKKLAINGQLLFSHRVLIPASGLDIKAPLPQIYSEVVR